MQVCGGRRKYVPVGLVAACTCALSCAHGKTGVGLLPNPSGVYARPMRLTPPQTRPDPPFSVCRCHGKSRCAGDAGTCFDQFNALSNVEIFTAVVWEPTLPRPVLFPWPPAYLQRRAGAGLRGLCETWMFRKSLQGRIHGAPRKPAPARQLRQTGGPRLFAKMHEATGRSPVPRYTMQSHTPKAVGAPKGPRCFGLYSEKPPQRRPVSLRAMTRRWISEVPS